MTDEKTDPFWTQLQEAEEDMRAPLVDIQDRSDHYLLVAEMPGIPKDKVVVDVGESRVEIKGENVLECELGAEDLAYLCNERSTTNFHRVVPLPGAIVPSESQANMENGVLVVKLPKVTKTEEPSVSLIIN